MKTHTPLSFLYFVTLLLFAPMADAELTASFTIDPESASIGQSISLDGSDSFDSDPEREVLEYLWVLGDGANLSGPTVSHAYVEPGIYQVNLRIRNDLDELEYARQNIQVTAPFVENDAPVANAGGPYELGRDGLVQLDASASYDPNAAEGDSIVSYGWDLDNNGSYEASGTSPTMTTDYFAEFPAGTVVTLGLRVTDENGAQNTTSTTVAIPEPSPIALFFDHLSVALLNAPDATTFPETLLGTVQGFTFRITNVGEEPLAIDSVTLGGEDVGQFSLPLPDVFPASDLATNASLDYTISFNPIGSASGLRHATVLIISNDPDSPEFNFSISGQALSVETDGDGDGLNDWAEYSLRNFGFDWKVAQPSEVTDYYDQASTAGLFTEAELAAVHISTVLLEVNEANTADFVITLEESVDLNGFSPITIDSNKLSVDGDGNIRYQMETADDKKFIRAGVKK